MRIVLTPPVAFLIYIALVGVLRGGGRVLAGRPTPSALEADAYASGEAAPTVRAAPGYVEFFEVALFFALLHLGVLILATGGLSGIGVVYATGLTLVLMVLTLQ